MQELVAELARPVALSDRAVRGLALIKAARREHEQAYGAEPTNEELSDATGFTLEQLERLQATERRPRGMEEQLSADGEATATVGDTIIDPAAERAYEQVLDQLEIRELRGLADQLSERERVVLRAHYGLGEPVRTLNQIGAELGLTAERARQIEVGALTKLREALAQPAPIGTGPGDEDVHRRRRTVSGLGPLLLELVDAIAAVEHVDARSTDQHVVAVAAGERRRRRTHPAGRRGRSRRSTVSLPAPPQITSSALAPRDHVGAAQTP